MKAGLLAVVAALSACSCLKSPDLDVAPVAQGSKYGSGNYAGGAAGAQPNNSDVKGLFDQQFVAGGFDRVYFDYDSAAIRGDAEATLNKFSEFAKANDVKGVTLEGHADERGTREYNLALGDRRAVSMKKYLIGTGLAPAQLTTISYGKERPAVEGHDESAWAKNRRGVIVLQ
ncbi:MAG: peptidoglycan-associated lipoprotein Pal [Blastochloris viridis]|uniref:Peptidoglycan-associated lipoprotein n=1 Tax=Blastochloris viridis TaxID=1079 RepID=A0A6N4R7F9_BLAVI|nr:MAG: peptidoglycan-associated lipoprotein Pal [Blastochloris viridis]